jgi:hypothetical protein
VDVDRQTDGVEWVLVTLFLISIALVVVAAVREIRRIRAGDPGGEPPKKAAKGGGGTATKEDRGE